MIYVINGGLSFIVIVGFYLLLNVDAQTEVCSLAVNPSSLPMRQVYENQTSGYKVFEMLYQPSNSTISLGPFSGNLAEFYKNKFELRIVKPSIFEFVVSSDSLQLPQYPSKSANVFLTVQVLCNGNLYPVSVLQIKSANMRYPIFYRTPYSIDISEATLPNTVVDTPILAIDWDPAPSYSVKFKIENDQYDGLFQLDQSNGLVHTAQNLPLEIQNENWTPEQLPSVTKLRLLKQLDYDTGIKMYSLNISATDVPAVDGVPSNINYTTLVIHVTDSDDMPPVFEQARYNGNISQDARKGASVLFDRPIFAKDGDKSLNSSVKYSFSPDSEYFEIDPNTGLVKMKKSFSHDSIKHSYDLIVKAEQVDNPHQASTTLLHIETDPENQHNYPSFRPCNYNLTLPENSPPGTQVVQLIVDDPNHISSGRFLLRLIETRDSGNFSLNNVTGVITVSETGVLDRERQPTYSLLATTVPMGETNNSLPFDSQCPTARISIALLDENDNTPMFSSNSYNFTISDVILRNKPVGIIHATDPDLGPNGDVGFRITDQDQTDGFNFVLSPYPNGTAEILIDFAQESRPKFKSEYQFYVEAFDQGAVPRVSRAKVIVTVVFGNSHVPVFERDTYRVNITENLPNGTRVIQVFATDPDEGEGGTFYYFINDTTNTFEIDFSNGWITVADESHLDREMTPTFTFTVGTIQYVPSNTSNVGPNNSATVIVSLLDVNDNEPRFIGTVNGSHTYEFSIDVTLEPNHLIGRIQAVDPDEGLNGQVSFVPLSVPNSFRMDTDGSIFLANRLLPNSDAVYNLIFEARDNPINERQRKSVVGMAKIYVTGVETSKLPKFTNLPNVITINELFPVDSLIYTITVTDYDPPTSQVFRIVQGNKNETFYIKENSIYVQEKLDAETVTNYDLLISYEGKQNVINDTLKIIIQDANDNAPKFERSKYEFFINESAALVQNLLIGKINATDADISYPNNEIVYELEGDTDLPFSVDPKTGELRLTSTTNLKEQYTFSVAAHDKGEPSFRGVTFVTVNVNSRSITTKKFLSTINFSNDMSTGVTTVAPRFTQIQYAVTIPENVPARNLTWVVATHPLGPVVYAMETSTSLFKIDPTSGRVATTGPLDYENTTEYHLNISACINSSANNPDHCGYTILLVQVIDQNDNPPDFNETEITVNMPTDAVIGSRVVQVIATDKDSGANKDVSYALKSGAATFYIDYETGWITTTVNLIPKIYNISVEAYDHGRPSLKAELAVIINVNGTNPHEPEFEYFVYDVAVKENSPVGTYVVQTVAKDPDPGDEGRISYRFKEPVPAFNIDSTTGKITTAAILDFETRNKYELVVEAIDHASSPRSGTTVVNVNVLDVNDNPPIFEPIPDRIYISSAKSPGSTIFTIKATDKDSAIDGNNEIVYSLSPSNIEYFQILPMSNALSVKTALVAGTFNIVLVATDKGQPPLNSTHPLQIIVMGDSLLYPVFNELSYDIKIGRNTSLPQVVQTFHANVKNGSLIYQLLPDSTNGFTLDPIKGELTADSHIFENMHLMETRYLIIRAINTADRNYFSDVSLTVTLTNFENVNIPLAFSSTLYRAMIKENSAAGTDLNLTVSVNNSQAFGSKLKYWLYPNDSFSINERGEIFSSKPIDLESLDPSSDGVISLQVFASSDLAVTSTILQIKVFDVNEFAPKFNSSTFSLTVSENVAPGTVLFNVQAEDGDFDDKRLRYQLIGNDTAKYFVIGSNGDIVKSTAPLFDREINSTISVTLRAIDQANETADVELVIKVLDENDNAPEFVGLPYIWNLTEGKTGVGQTFTITAKDNDEGENARVQFRILDGNNMGSFLLTEKGKNQAEISVVKELNRDERAQIFIVIEGRDNGHPPLFAVTTLEINVLDFNNNSPKFYRKTYTSEISTLFPVNFPFLTVYAEDKDLNSNLSFRFVNDSTGYFQINSVTGQISLMKVLPKQNATFNLIVEVSDGQFTDQANVTFNVVVGQETAITVIPILPPQFNKPVFNFSAIENKNDSVIGQISMSNYDLNAFQLSIEPDRFAQLFGINASGYIYAKQPLHYMPDQGSVSFLVSAQDKNNSNVKVFVPVVIDIVDLNDHVPEFSQPDYVGLVPPTAKKGYTIILDIRATDLDSGSNADIAYKLLGEDSSCFQMDNKSAQITLLCDVNFYQKNFYKFQVVATDENGEGNSSSANVTIIISPPQAIETTSEIPTPPPWTNISCSSFNLSVPFDKITLLDHTPSSTPIYVVPVPQLNGASASCIASYSITGAGSEYFSINQINGLVKVAKDIDLAKMKQEKLFSANSSDYTLTLNITANLSDGKQITATFISIKFSTGIVTYEDRVLFDSNDYTFEFVEEQKIGTFVGHVNATSNSSSSLHYMVLFSQQFTIPDPSQGIIVSNAVFDFEGPNKELYFLVQVTNGRSTDFTAVTVVLLDINDNAPEFRESEYKFEIPEGPYGSGATVGYVEAYDIDSGLNALLNYSIVETGIPFRIDPTNGRLQVFGNVDREQTALYMFHVLVVDNGNPQKNATTVVNVTIIDVNDNPPTFVNISTNVLFPDNAPARQIVTQLFAVDPDEGSNGRIIFKLLSNEDSFSIGQEDGVIRNLLPLSAKRNEIYYLLISASDLGRPPQTTYLNITVHIVNGSLDRPVFPQDVYYKEIAPSSNLNGTLIQVSAGQGALIYAITDGNELGLFEITNETGEIHLRRIPRSDEFGKGYTLTVLAKNLTSGDTATTSVRLYFVDQNYIQLNTSAPPSQRAFDRTQYWVEVAENIPPPVFIIDLNSTFELQNVPTRYRILSGSMNKFTINETSGIVYTTEALDRENQSLYVMVIQARPSSSRRTIRQSQQQQRFLGLNEFIQIGWDETILVVNVTDVNDNPPYFPQGRDFNGILISAADTKSGQTISVVKAMDPDSSSILTYSVIANPNDDSDKFSINPQTGMIIATKSFDQLSLPEFHFTVMAFDGIFNATTPVTVYKLLPDIQAIIEVNRRPEFVQLYIGLLEKALSRLTNWNVSVSNVRPSSDGTNRSDVYVFAVDPVAQRVVDAKTLSEKIKSDSVIRALQTDLDALRIENVIAAPLTSSYTPLVSAPEIALIVVSSIIILLALLGLLFMLRWWKRKETDRLNSEYMLNSQSSGTRPYEVVTVDSKTGTLTSLPSTLPISKRMESRPITAPDPNEPYEAPGTISRPLHYEDSEEIVLHHSPVRF